MQIQITNFISIFSLIICLCIPDIQLTQPTMDVVQSANDSCIFDVHRCAKAHGRKKRFLLFEKGAAFSVTTSSVKSLISGVPRGLNIITEESIYYELPSSVTIPTVKPPQPSTTTSPSTISKVEIKPKPWFTYPGPYYRYKRNTYSIDDKNTQDDIFSDSLNIGGLFFQQISKFADMYGYNEQHCIMRTICESKHLLYPKGQSLFHDIIRIIIKFSLPTMKNNGKYLTAAKIVNLSDCANLYGPHCRISFLDYFTQQIHGKFM